jgi:tellurite resistance protein
MVLAQLRLSLDYSRLSFSPGFWAFTFSYAAVATDALAWLALKRPPGEPATRSRP